MSLDFKRSLEGFFLVTCELTVVPWIEQPT